MLPAQVEPLSRQLHLVWPQHVLPSHTTQLTAQTYPHYLLDVAKQAASSALARHYLALQLTT
jgi:hypothetical protein